MNDIWMERVLNLTRQPYSYFPNKQSRLLYSTKISTSVPKNIQCYFPNMKLWGFFSSGITQIRHLIPFVYIVGQLLPPSLTSDRSLLYKLTKRASLLLLLLLDIFGLSDDTELERVTKFHGYWPGIQDLIMWPGRDIMP